MRVPTMRGVIERRILVNFRIDPAVLQGVVPHPFRPQVVSGKGIGGICLIRLGQLRPNGLPTALGLRSENAAHRIAVEWDAADGVKTGVYIPRRDTDSALNALAGGRLFPGVHHRADFEVTETPPQFQVALHSRDDATRVWVEGTAATAVPDGSVFESLAAASAFFEGGAVGFSPGRQAGCFDGLELCCEQWAMEPLAVTAVGSSFFEDRARFPVDSVAFDSAFLMRNIAHTWQARDEKKARES